MITLFELNKLINWFNEEIIEKGVLVAYENLTNKIKINTMANQSKVPFEEEKQILIKKLINIKMFKLSIHQINILEKLSIYNLLGISGEQIIKDKFYNIVDIASIYSYFETSLRNLKSAQQSLTQLKEQITKIIDVDNHDEEENLIRFIYKNEASIKSLKSLKDYSNELYLIGIGFSALTNEKPEAFRLISAEKGSIIFVLAASQYILKNFLQAIKMINDSILQIKKIEVQQKNIEILDIEKQTKALLLDELKKQRDNKMEQAQVRITTTLMKANNVEGEIEGKTRTAVKHLIDLYVKGGEVDVSLIEYSEADEESVSSIKIDKNKECSLLMEEISRIKNELYLIENSNDINQNQKETDEEGTNEENNEEALQPAL